MASKKYGIFAACLALQSMTLPVFAESLAGSYLAGRQAQYTNDFDASAQYFTRALLRDPGNPQILESAILAHLSMGQVAKAVVIARKLEADKTGSQVGHMVLVADDVTNARYDEILTRIAADRGIGPLVDGLVGAWAHLGAGSMVDAMNAFDKIADERGLRGFALYHKALAMASVGDFGGAEEIFSGRAAGPLQATRRAAIARMEILSQLDRNPQAIALIDDLFGADLDPGLRLLRGRLEAGEVLPFAHIQGPRDGIAEVFYSVAAALSGEAEAEYTLLYARITQNLRPDHVDAILLSAQLLEQLRRYDLATETYGEVGTDHPAFYVAELGRAEALRSSGKLDVAVEVLEKLGQSHADLPAVRVALGDLLRQMDRFEGAVAAYDMALSLYPTEEPRQWFIYYARGVAQERLGDWPKSEADFRKALVLSPEQPQVLNYLGYSMVEQQINLDEALSMIERAVAVSPDSGYIIDSLGWVLYRLGRYEEAIGHMEQAAQLMAVDPIVNDHLGDVLWAVGRQLEAQFQWRRALSFEPDEEDASRIRQKLEVGLDAVLKNEGAEPLQLADDDS